MHTLSSLFINPNPKTTYTISTISAAATTTTTTTTRTNVTINVCCCRRRNLIQEGRKSKPEKRGERGWILLFLFHSNFFAVIGHRHHHLGHCSAISVISHTKSNHSLLQQSSEYTAHILQTFCNTVIFRFFFSTLLYSIPYRAILLQKHV